MESVIESTGRKTMPSHYQIFDYWKDRQIGNEWVLMDYGEPSCWGCGKPIHVETKKDLIDCNYKAIWNRTHKYLNRCHIIPKALGGSNEPDNLFLMCESCHHESPDTPSSEGFFAWVLLKRAHCIFGEDARQFISNLKGLCHVRNIDVTDVFMYLSSKHVPSLIADFSKRTIAQAGVYSDFNLPVLLLENFESERKEYEDRKQDIRRELENRYTH